MILQIKNKWTILLIILCAACASKTTDTATEEDVQEGTPVTITAVSKATLTETIELNATSSFLLKTPVKSVANGYLQNLKIKQGDYVNKGGTLMSVITKESQSIGNSINNLDTSFHFKGEINIIAPGNGYISQLNFQNGDYVQDGEQIAIISDAKSFVFVLELPYELTQLLKLNKNVQLILPDSSKLNGTIEKPMPSMDAASQTQSYLIAVNSNRMIPENLVAKVLLVKASKQNATSVPKAALLTDETQNSFWVMKLLNDSIAVKVSIQKGIETSDQMEILSPLFSDADRLLLTGNYGLPDTANVQIKK
ncbi:MAG: efflux RND transporter periplasmic adaptor subunit [Bacteroidia bacterium]